MADGIPAAQSGGLSMVAAKLDVLKTVGATLDHGTWLNAAIMGGRRPRGT